MEHRHLNHQRFTLAAIDAGKSPQRECARGLPLAWKSPTPNATTSGCTGRNAMPKRTTQTRPLPDWERRHIKMLHLLH